MSTPDLLLEGYMYWTTSESVSNHRNKYSNDFKVSIPEGKLRILLVDDSSFNVLGALERSKRLLIKKYPEFTIFKTSLYAIEKTAKVLDYYTKIVPYEHWFEKDIFIRKRQKTGYDMDGVLCIDPIPSVVNNDLLYEKWVRGAIPYRIPEYKIDYIITGRLEKYRKDTEEWLRLHNVKYGYLIMQEDTDRRIGTDHALYKANNISKYLGSDGIYIESNLKQANRIYELTGIQVLCIENLELFGVRLENKVATKGNWLFR